MKEMSWFGGTSSREASSTSTIGKIYCRGRYWGRRMGGWFWRIIDMLVTKASTWGMGSHWRECLVSQ